MPGMCFSMRSQTSISTRNVFSLYLFFMTHLKKAFLQYHQTDFHAQDFTRKDLCASSRRLYTVLESDSLATICFHSMVDKQTPHTTRIAWITSDMPENYDETYPWQESLKWISKTRLPHVCLQPNARSYVCAPSLANGIPTLTCRALPQVI